MATAAAARVSEARARRGDSVTLAEVCAYPTQLYRIHVTAVEEKGEMSRTSTGRDRWRGVTPASAFAVAFALACAVIGVLVFIVSFGIPRGGGFYPQLVAVSIVVLALAQAWREATLSRPAGSETTSDPIVFKPRAALVLVITAAETVAISMFGFLLGAAAGSALILRFVFGMSAPRALFWAVVLTAALAGLQRALGLELPGIEG